MLSSRLLERRPAFLLTNWKGPGRSHCSESQPGSAECKWTLSRCIKRAFQQGSRQSTGLLGAAFLKNHPATAPPAPRAHHHPREQPQPQPGRHSRSRVFCCCVSFPAPQGSPGHPSPPMAKPSPGWDHQPRAVRCTLPIRTPGVPAVPIGHQSDDTADVVTMPKRWNRPCAQGPCLEVTGCHPAARRQAAF